MARKTTTIDGGKLSEIRNFLMHLVSGSPSSPAEGQFWYDTVTKVPMYQDDAGEQPFAGTTPDATTGSKGVIQLAGDLDGTAASPEVVSAQAGFLIDGDDPLDRANHIGTQLAATISNLAAVVKAYRLDEFADPTSDIPMAGVTFTGLRDAVSAQEPATLAQLSAAITGIDFKSVRAATTANVTIATALNNGDTLDGVTLATNDLVLVKNQSAPAENGVYVVGASPARVDWMDTAAEVDGKCVIVEDGTVNAGRLYFTVSEVTTLGTDAISFTKIFSPTDLIDLTSQVTGALPVANGGTGQTAAKAARETGLGAAGYYSSATHSAGTTITIAQATHGLRASRGLLVQTQDEATGDLRLDDVSVAANGDVTVTFAASQSANTIRVTIIG